jgi:hypothetical protein
MRFYPLLLGLLCLPLFGQAQNHTESIQLNWKFHFFSERGNEKAILTFEGAAHTEAEFAAPLWVLRHELPYYADLRAELQNPEYEAVPLRPDLLLPELGSEPRILAQTNLQHKRPVALVQVMPLRRNPQNGQVERLIRASLRLQASPSTRPRSGPPTTTTSVLANGEIYKITVEQTGMHRMDYTFLKNLGLDVDNLNPQLIQVFGNGGLALPEALASPRIDDLQELAIAVEGEADGRFNTSDFIAFYAQGPKNWIYRNGFFEHQTHPYSNSITYFIRVGVAPGKRLGQQSPPPSTDYVTNSYDALAHHEEDKINLLEEAFALPPSGRIWYGELFKFTRQYSFGFNFPNRLAAEPVRIRTATASRHFSGIATFSVSHNGTVVHTASHGATNSYIYSMYAIPVTATGSFTTTGNNLSLVVNYSHSSNTSEGWLDYLSLNARSSLQFTGGQMAFRDQRSLGKNGALYQVSGITGNVQFWDVTEWGEAKRINATCANGTCSFSLPTDQLREIIAFDGSNWLTPTAQGRIGNQNLHGQTQVPDLLLIYHRDLAAQAQRLADHRRQTTGLKVVTAEIEQVYNEFSGGTPDISAIRNYAKMLYDREQPGEELRYLLLFGDGSFDPRNLKNRSNNRNLIPVFETVESLHPIYTYVTEDYFGLLDDNEGSITANHDLDIGIGRLPASTASEAQVMVDKIIAYETDPQHFGDWRSRMTFVADDEDGNIHMDYADTIARPLLRRDTNFVQNKIYIDAFQQVSTSGGNRYPSANQAILDDLFKGTLIWNYMGHGGDDGLAQERIFTNLEINGLRNLKRLPLFITATCSFTPFDDPNIVSAGELLLLNPQGGSVACMTTVRVVYANENKTLTDNTMQAILDWNGDRRPTLGEVMALAKNRSGVLDGNSRKYVLMGDPSMTLAYPKERVQVEQINGQALTGSDTIRALQRVSLSGSVRNRQGQLLDNFNGIVYVTVYDKADSIRTKANDAGSRPYNFTLRSKIIFKGRAAVSQGRFTLNFVVPKDINYAFGQGLISCYADNGLNLDAHGSYLGLVVGGTSSQATADNTPPQVEVLMNNEQFVRGGMTDESPLLLVKLYDDNGINIVGNSVGHDLLAMVTQADGRQSSYVLNDFYETELNSYQRGTARYQLKNLPEGLHQVRVQAWDVYNNMGEGDTEFIVSNSAELALRQVLNYPNPFTTSTRFQFEHNFSNQSLEILVQIFTVSGKLVKTIQHQTFAEGYRVDDIAWDGLDEFGDQLARGVYIYKITVRAQGSQEAKEQSSAFQKLVILK